MDHPGEMIEDAPAEVPADACATQSPVQPAAFQDQKQEVRGIGRRMRCPVLAKRQVGDCDVFCFDTPCVAVPDERNVRAAAREQGPGWEGGYAVVPQGL
eukprot:48567-Rhodomonas_salina.3